MLGQLQLHVEAAPGRDFPWRASRYRIRKLKFEVNNQMAKKSKQTALLPPRRRVSVGNLIRNFRQTSGVLIGSPGVLNCLDYGAVQTCNNMKDQLIRKQVHRDYL